MTSLREKELSEGKIIPISFDYHFVRIFGRKKNMDIIEYFISDYYDIPINEVAGNIEILSRDLEVEKKKYSEKFRIDNIDLVVASKTKYNKSNEKLVRWCKILNASTREEIIKELGDKLMDEKTRKKILKEVERNSRDEDLYDIHEMYSTHEMEQQSIIDEAVEKAVEKTTKEVTEEVMKQNQLKIAKKLLEEGSDIDFICKITDLPKEKIEKIKRRFKIVFFHRF